ncbi:MAG: GntR family transcriptional regulator [Clostridia bacterium]|nr:GntR family transcriptional regulator [Clostridia bacterium]MDD4048486.1 GntR family transcriptional regulator [Clostridia bacterium]
MSERRFDPLEIEGDRPLRDIVFEVLREATLDNVLKPGERLMEVQLAEELGVSRTPIREAIRKLELEGFATIIPRKGAYVTEVSYRDVHEVFEIRATLESLACGLAAERANPKEIEEMGKYLLEENECLENDDIIFTVRTDVGLHELIYKATRNKRLITLTGNLKEQLFRLRSTSMTLPGRKKKSLEEHKGIVEAIVQHDVELAQKLGQEHIEFAEQAMVELFNANGSGEYCNK